MADYPRRRSDVSARLVEGETVVLDRQADLVHQLNQTASFIWHRCDGQCTAREIAEQLGAAFDVDLDIAEGSVTAALQQFEQLGLLERTQG
jgi:DNA-binding MarR family transcriptional regulator